MNERILIAPAGWEERFEQGVYIDITEFSPSKIVVPFSQMYANRTRLVRDKIRAKAQTLNIIYCEFEHDYCEPVSLYKSLLDVFEAEVFLHAANIRFNGTTAPRDLIWYALHFLSEKKIPTEFSYFRPVSYGKYLSRDARAPRLILKRSGIAYPDQPTCILAISGFDRERLSQLKQRYEPKKMFVVHQVGDQLENKTRNASAEHTPTSEEEHFEIDCYDTVDNSLRILCAKLDDLPEAYNVIAASLGPKPSALILFKLTQLRPEIGLVYIPAGDYSEDYSIGIDLEHRYLNNVSWVDLS